MLDISTLLCTARIYFSSIRTSQFTFQVTFGQRERVSQIDAQQMNLLYKKQCEEGVGGGGNGGEL